MRNLSLLYCRRRFVLESKAVLWVISGLVALCPPRLVCTKNHFCADFFARLGLKTACAALELQACPAFSFFDRVGVLLHAGAEPVIFPTVDASTVFQFCRCVDVPPCFCPSIVVLVWNLLFVLLALESQQVFEGRKSILILQKCGLYPFVRLFGDARDKFCKVSHNIARGRCFHWQPVHRAN